MGGKLDSCHLFRQNGVRSAPHAQTLVRRCIDAVGLQMRSICFGGWQAVNAPLIRGGIDHHHCHEQLVNQLPGE
jgi:hypothetical protein